MLLRTDSVHLSQLNLLGARSAQKGGDDGVST